jgi:hypothetical protein
VRICKKTGCGVDAAATCTFHYPLSQVWISPLVPEVQPGAVDLCLDHADRMVAPLGWTLTDLRRDRRSAESGLAS